MKHVDLDNIVNARAPPQRTLIQRFEFAAPDPKIQWNPDRRFEAFMQFYCLIWWQYHTRCRVDANHKITPNCTSFYVLHWDPQKKAYSTVQYCAVVAVLLFESVKRSLAQQPRGTMLIKRRTRHWRASYPSPPVTAHLIKWLPLPLLKALSYPTSRVASNAFSSQNEIRHHPRPSGGPRNLCRGRYAAERDADSSRAAVVAPIHWQ